MRNTISVTIENQFEELRSIYQYLQLIREEENTYIVGQLRFSASYLGSSPIYDQYDIKIFIPEDFPNEPPRTFECSGKIPSNFHTNPDGTLCLGSPLEVRMKFKNNLLIYVQDLVVPFLYSYSHYQKYGKLPYGELSHGALGILESYKEMLRVTNNNVVLKFLYILATGKYRGHHVCPCGSAMKIRKCHGPQILTLMKYQDTVEFTQEYMECLNFVSKKAKNRRL